MSRQQKLLVPAVRGQHFQQIDLHDGQVEGQSGPFSAADQLSISGQLPDGGFLIKKQSRAQAIQFWTLREKEWSLLFEFTKDPYRWLGNKEELHYFLSDFKDGQTTIFAAKASPEGTRFQSLIQTRDRFIVDAILKNNGLYTLEETAGKGQLRHWTLAGQLQAQYQLPDALQQLDLQFYPETGTLLVRQLDVDGGLRYIAVNPAYSQPVEVVHETLSDHSSPPLKKAWHKIQSYDGTAIPVCIVHSARLSRVEAAPSLFIPMPDQPTALLHSQPDLALSNRFLSRGGILVFVFSRGNRRLGREWYQQGTGPSLQLAFDDLQAALTYSNTQRIGQAAQRSVWAVAEQALSGAALLAQRPDLARNIFLAQGRYDLRPTGQDQSSFFSSAWWLYQDSIPDRLISQYSPYLAGIPTKKGPRTMIQSTNPYIFDPAVVFLARLQKEMPLQEKLWAPMSNQQIRRADSQRREWESKLDTFLYSK